MHSHVYVYYIFYVLITSSPMDILLLYCPKNHVCGSKSLSFAQDSPIINSHSHGSVKKCFRKRIKSWRSFASIIRRLMRTRCDYRNLAAQWGPGSRWFYLSGSLTEQITPTDVAIIVTILILWECCENFVTLKSTHA